MTKIGQLGEKFIGKWLESKDYVILHYNWRCRWGEIDIIAQNNTESSLIFVEVKTRSKNNWDENGLLAVTPKKQEKIRLTAEMFLASNPELTNFNCRFDVAILNYKIKQKFAKKLNNNEYNLDSLNREKCYEFTLIDYLESAF
jgi:putative endonuclease